MTSHHHHHASSIPHASPVSVNELSGLTSLSAVTGRPPSSAFSSPPATLGGHVYNLRRRYHPLNTRSGGSIPSVTFLAFFLFGRDASSHSIPNRSSTIIIVPIIFVVLASPVCYTRQFWRLKVHGLDDIMYLLAYLTLVGETILVCVAAYYGFGRHRIFIEAMLLRATFCFYVYWIQSARPSTLLISFPLRCRCRRRASTNHMRNVRDRDQSAGPVQSRRRSDSNAASDLGEMSDFELDSTAEDVNEEPALPPLPPLLPNGLGMCVPRASDLSSQFEGGVAESVVSGRGGAGGKGG